MCRFKYSAFGLTICSDFELTHSRPSTAPPQVHLRLGRVPRQLDNAAGRGVLYQCTPQKFLLHIPGIAYYLVSDGSDVLVEPEPGSEPNSVRLFLFGSVFGVLLHQRGLLPLHGSAVATRRGAAVFAGVSGSGKSALAFALSQRGYPVLTDEICAIEAGAQKTVKAGNPYLMVWADTLQAMGVNPGGMEPARPQLSKYIFPVVGVAESQAAELHAIYVLEPVNAELTGPHPVHGLKKVELLAQNVYRPRLVQEMNLHAEQFRKVIDVSRHARVTIIRRPRGSFDVRQIVDLVERDLDT